MHLIHLEIVHFPQTSYRSPSWEQLFIFSFYMWVIISTEKRQGWHWRHGWLTAKIVWLNRSYVRIYVYVDNFSTKRQLRFPFSCSCRVKLDNSNFDWRKLETLQIWHFGVGYHCWDVWVHSLLQIFSIHIYWWEMRMLNN